MDRFLAYIQLSLFHGLEGCTSEERCFTRKPFWASVLKTNKQTNNNNKTQICIRAFQRVPFQRNRLCSTNIYQSLSASCFGLKLLQSVSGLGILHRFVGTWQPPLGPAPAEGLEGPGAGQGPVLTPGLARLWPRVASEAERPGRLLVPAARTGTALRRSRPRGGDDWSQLVALPRRPSGAPGQLVAGRWW